MLSTVFFALAFFSVSDRVEALDITTITQGTVMEARPNSIAILKDLNSEKVRVAITPNTVYDNAQKWNDIKAGDKVQIEYQEAHKNNLATEIKKMETEQ